MDFQTLISKFEQTLRSKNLNKLADQFNSLPNQVIKTTLITVSTKNGDNHKESCLDLVKLIKAYNDINVDITEEDMKELEEWMKDYHETIYKKSSYKQLLFS